MPKKKVSATQGIPPAKLVGSGRAGDFVHDTQEMGTKAGFRNVSRKWLDQCLTFEQVMDQAEDHHRQIEDYRVPLSAFQPALDDQHRLVMRHEGTDYLPTPYSLGHIAQHAGMPAMTLEILAGLRPDLNDRPRNEAADRETLLRMLRDSFRFIPARKEFLFRTQTDGTLRAWLSKDYLIMDNRWFLNIVRDVIPGGLFSHWRDDGDYSTLWGNVLIPDSIREEQDSDYGGMLSIGNSEIGRRRLSCRPSLFRAICMNGCIWGQKKGETFQRVHRGKVIDDDALRDLRNALRKHVHAQIPLITTAIDMLLATRDIGWDGILAKPMFAAVGGELGLSRKANAEVLAAWKDEANQPETDALKRTGFAIINAVTRSGREAKDPATWVKRDELGGKLLSYSPDRWKNLIASARSMRGEEVEAAYPSASVN